MLRPIRAAALVLLLITIASAPAAAENKAAAREAFRRAQRHYNLAEYADALTDFKEAYRNFEDPSFLFNIAQCERQLNHKQEAIRAYKTYLAATPDAKNHDDVAAIIRNLEVALDDERAAANRPPQGTLGTAPDAGSKAPQPATSTNPALTASGETPHADKPAYKKWWLWTIVGGAAVAVGVGLGVGLSQSSAPPATATTSLGTIHPF